MGLPHRLLDIFGDLSKDSNPSNFLIITLLISSSYTLPDDDEDDWDDEEFDNKDFDGDEGEEDFDPGERNED